MGGERLLNVIKESSLSELHSPSVNLLVFKFDFLRYMFCCVIYVLLQKEHEIWFKSNTLMLLVSYS